MSLSVISVSAESGKWIYFPSSPALYNVNNTSVVTFFISEQNTFNINFLSPSGNNNIMTLSDIDNGETAQYFADRVANFIESEDDHFLNIQEIYNELN